jgi:hypothetical protein
VKAYTFKPDSGMPSVSATVTVTGIVVVTDSAVHPGMERYLQCTIQDVKHNGKRLHQGINQRIPAQFNRKSFFSIGNIQSVAFLGGLHHSYSRGTAPPHTKNSGGWIK